MSDGDWRAGEAIKGRFYDEDGRPVENFDGRTMVALHRPNWFNLALQLAHPDVIRAYKEVPKTHWEEDVEEETYLAKIECPCGEAHLVELGLPRTSDCNRHFAYLGTPGARGRRVVYAMRLNEDDGEAIVD